MPSAAGPLRRLAQLLPDRADAAQLWRDWRAKRRPMVLRPYVDLHTRWRLAAKVLVPAALGLICLVYGFFFALTAPYLLVPMAAPVAVLALLSIWALPENNAVPTAPLELFFSALLVGLILWPNYLALTLPGLPWITMIRLTGFPMAFFLLVCASMSPEFRDRIVASAKGMPILLIMALFAVNSFVCLPFSHSIGNSVNYVLVQQLNWTGVFFVGLYIFHTRGRVESYVGMLLLLAIPISLLAMLEYEEQYVPFAAHVPSFLRVADESAQRALTGAVRGATGQYRAKGTFSTALGLAEYISLMTPFAMHWAVGRYPRPIRLLGLLLLPIIYVIVRTTDARLGILGYLISILVYVFLWSVMRWRQRFNDLVAAALVYAYPAAFLAILAASMVVHKIHVLIFGGGATAASNERRQEQYTMAFHALMKNPIGHGAGQSGMAMGYGADDFIAIDSYYISIALDYGVVGIVLYVAMFAIVIAAAIDTVMRLARNPDREMLMLIPLAACLSAFLMIRSVFSQPDIHPLIFAFLAMTVCLVARARNEGFLVARKAFSSGERKGPRRTPQAAGAAGRPKAPALP